MAAAPEGHHEPAYPLAGLIISGWGTQAVHTPDPESLQPFLDVFQTQQFRDATMLPPRTANPAIYAHTVRLTHEMPPGEFTMIHNVWVPRWRVVEWGQHVVVPVMVALAEHDALWKGTDGHLRDFMASFPCSVRVDGSLIKGAPHNLEMSYWSRGWYTQCFGFAAECAASFECNKLIINAA